MTTNNTNNNEPQVTCNICNAQFNASDARSAYNTEGEEVLICVRCSELHTSPCDSCHDDLFNDALRNVFDGNSVCNDCYNEHYGLCSICECDVHRDYLSWDMGREEYICDDCIKEKQLIWCESCESFLDNPHKDRNRKKARSSAGAYKLRAQFVTKDNKLYFTLT